MTIRAIQITRSPMCVCIDLQQLVSGADPTHKLARCDAPSTSANGMVRPCSCPVSDRSWQGR